MNFVLLLVPLAAICNASVLRSRAAKCRDVVIPVNVSAHNKQLPANLTATDLTASFLNGVIATLPTVVFGGSYTIAGRYCEPEKFEAARQTTLQLLVHGITYDRNYWSGLAAPGTRAGQDEYSWIAYASQQGFPTLSIDRLCNGVSSRPNGLAVCQIPLQAETMNAVIQQAREGSLPGIPTKFSKIAYVGHSYGSLVASALALQHPNAADALVLTGFTDQLLFGEAGVALEPQWLPAAIQDPAKFAHDDPSYIRATSAEGAQHLFYYGDFDPAMLAHDYDTRQTVTLGELGTVTFGQLKAPSYKGPVLVYNGDHDTIFCEPSALSPVMNQFGDCVSGEVDKNAKAFFPSASAFQYGNAANTGHCLNNHRTAQGTFKAVHEFLSAIGL